MQLYMLKLDLVIAGMQSKTEICQGSMSSSSFYIVLPFVILELITLGTPVIPVKISLERTKKRQGNRNASPQSTPNSCHFKMEFKKKA
ncbi:uncharacterized protein LOC144565375 isoform X2 [Carex rostrata]